MVRRKGLLIAIAYEGYLLTNVPGIRRSSALAYWLLFPGLSVSTLKNKKEGAKSFGNKEKYVVNFLVVS